MTSSEHRIPRTNSYTNIMNVKEIIESAFGDLNENTVNFKLVQTVLFLIARQMRILERRVEIDLGHLTLLPSNSTLSVTEVKIHAMQKKKKAGPKRNDGAEAKPGRGAEAKSGGSSGSKPGGGAGVKPGGGAGAKPGGGAAAKPGGGATAKPGGGAGVKPAGGVGAGKKPDNSSDILNILETQREKELRVIHQSFGALRADSFEEAKKSPTPMASISSMEAQYEKLLVVKTVPSSEARNGEELYGNKRMSQISVVTQEQFEQLEHAVRLLEKKLLPPGTAEFPENYELMEQLRKGASLTDAMAALQLSARLEATEKVLARMTSMVTEIVRQTPGVTLDSETQRIVVTDPTAKGGKSRKKVKKGKFNANTEIPAASSDAAGTQEAMDNQDFVTYAELVDATHQMKTELLDALQNITNTTTANAKDAQKLSMLIDAKMDIGSDITKRMANLEHAVKHFADKINALDTDLSSQMTTYQEHLTQMQHDLEIGLDTLNDMLSSSGTDTVAIAELHARFTALQIDFENIAIEQKNLKDNQNSTTYDLASLWKHIEILRDVKSDREEVADALRDKAGIGELNGLVTIEQFDAVRGDFGKRIVAAFDTFSSQEKTWQTAIEFTAKALNEKADLAQVLCLKDDINKHLNRFKERIQTIQDIVGEPKAAIVSKKVFRDTACLSCGSPAHMDIEEPNKVPALPKFHSFRQPAEGAEAESKTKGDGDYAICYPNLPIPHPRDPRSHICKRYCGGSHTTVTNRINSTPPDMTLIPLRPVNTTPGTDGKPYLVDEQTKTPCLPCNMPNPEPANPAPTEIINEQENISLTQSAHEDFMKVSEI